MQAAHTKRHPNSPEVRRNEGRVLNARGRETERVDGPEEVGVPVGAAKRETLTDGRLIDLDGEDAALLKVDNLVAERESELLALGLAVDLRIGRVRISDIERKPSGTTATTYVNAGEGPVEDGNRSSKHSLDRLRGEGLGEGRPADGHRSVTGDVGN